MDYSNNAHDLRISAAARVLCRLRLSGEQIARDKMSASAASGCLTQKASAQKEKGRRFRGAPSFACAKIERHPNPVRIKMSSAAIFPRATSLRRALTARSSVRRFPMTDRRRHCAAGFRQTCTDSRLTSLALRPTVADARRLAAGPLPTAMPEPRFSTLFPDLIRGRIVQTRPKRSLRAVASLEHSASERRRCSSASSREFVRPAIGFMSTRLQNRETCSEYKFLGFFRLILFHNVSRNRRWKFRRSESTTYPAFRHIREKLFAGISTISSREIACFCPSGSRSCSISRTPQAGSRIFRLALKSALEGAV